jgi:hypothetical protein
LIPAFAISITIVSHLLLQTFYANTTKPASALVERFARKRAAEP